MTPEAQRIAIAETDGWKEMPVGGVWQFKDEDSYAACPEQLYCQPLPDYLNDLNAMHEAEKSLSRGPGYYQPGGWGNYVKALADVCAEQHPIDATAAQRAEAFLRSRNLWKD